MDRPELLLAGADLGGRTVWTWQWDNGTHPEHLVLPAGESDEATKVLDALRQALPDPDPNHDESADCAVQRCLTGALASRGSEFKLVRRLAQLFLPDRLTRQIRDHCTPQSPGLLRVLPAPSAYAVPWELLPLSEPDDLRADETDCDHRLIELFDVVQVAPPLTRDGTDVGPAVWDPASSRLRVIDPEHPQPVLPRIYQARRQNAQLYRWPREDFGRTRNANHVLDDLAAEPARMLWVGHVAMSGDPVTAALQLSQDELSANALFSASDAHDRLNNWAAPARVGLVACQSGADLQHVEPFGLVVAFLERGAELVTATRWTLPTDKAFAELTGHESGADLRKFLDELGPFNAAAQALDQIHEQPDPIKALAEWQRQKLQEWRSGGALVDSPIIWASLANYHAPERTVRNPCDNTPETDSHESA